MKDSRTPVVFCVLALCCLLAPNALAQTETAESAAAIQSAIEARVNAGLRAIDTLDPPPGPVSPTMKTLDEIEPRFIVNRLPGDANWTHIITEPGSYYLTGDVVGEDDKGGILIAAQHVTLDLHGFRVAGGNQSAEHNGIEAGDAVRITSGWIVDWTGSGILAGDQSVVEDVSVINTTASQANDAINLGLSANVERCRVNGMFELGIGVDGHSIVSGCVVTDGSRVGISAQDLSASGASLIKDCIATGGQTGISVFAGTIIDCTTKGNEKWGFRATQSSRLENCLSIEDGTSFVNSDQGIFTNNDAAFQIIGASLLEGCIAWNSNATAFRAYSETSFVDCTAMNAAGVGFSIVKSISSPGSPSTMTRCHAIAGGSFGFAIGGSNTFNTVLTDCIAFDNAEGQFVIHGQTELRGCRAGLAPGEQQTEERSVFAGPGSDGRCIIKDCTFDVPLLWLGDDGLIQGNRLNGTPAIKFLSHGDVLIIQNLILGGAANVIIGNNSRTAAIVDDPDLAGPWSNLAY